MKVVSLISVLFVVSSSVFSQLDRKAEDAQGIAIGEKAPVFSAVDIEGNPFVLTEALKKNPIVMIFYRGHWCPVCNRHLSDIQDSLQLIMNKGALVVAVSAEKSEYQNAMAEKTNAQFMLLYDEGYRIADAYDVSFKAPSTQVFTYNVVLGANLKETQTDESGRLPIPATYIIGQDGTIVWRHFDANYKKRSTVQDIILHLPE